MATAGRAGSRRGNMAPLGRPKEKAFVGGIATGFFMTAGTAEPGSGGSENATSPFTGPVPDPISRTSPQPFGTGCVVAPRIQRIDRLRFHRTLKLRFL